MPLPTPEPTTRDRVKSWLGIAADDDTDDQVVDEIVGAVNALVRGLRVAQRYNTDPAPADWPASITMGATMLAARFKRRQNTPGGVEVSGQFGVAYVRRNDPDVAQLLELGDYSAPGVG